MPRSRHAIQSALRRKGFQQYEKTKHRYYHFLYNGKLTGVSTFVSRGTKYKEISDGLLSKMWKQLYLNNKQELLDLVDCPMSEQQLVALLRNNGILPAE